MNDFKPIVLYKGRTARTANSAREAEQFRLEGYAPLQPLTEHPRFLYRGAEKLRVENPEEEAAAAKQGFGRTPPDGLSAEQAPAVALANENTRAEADYRGMLEAANKREDDLGDRLTQALAANKSLGEQLDAAKAEAERNADLVAQLNLELAEATAPKAKK